MAIKTRMSSAKPVQWRAQEGLTLVLEVCSSMAKGEEVVRGNKVVVVAREGMVQAVPVLKAVLEVRAKVDGFI